MLDDLLSQIADHIDDARVWYNFSAVNRYTAALTKKQIDIAKHVFAIKIYCEDEYEYYVLPNGDRHGPYKLHRDDVGKSGNYIDGKRSGIWTFGDDGLSEMIEYINYVNGTRNGSYILERGLYTECKGFHKHDSRTGLWTYYEDGEFSYAETYDKGFKTGPFKKRIRGSNRLKIGNYVSNIKHGEYKVCDYYDQTKIFTTGEYIDGHKAGTWTYYQDGKIAYSMTYTDEKITRSTYVDNVLSETVELLTDSSEDGEF